MFRAIRLPQNPIIHPLMDDSLGTNINGPSLIRTPDWLPGRLGRYYLYFAHHQGEHIRLAYADHIEGPWKIYAPGTLHLQETPCREHIASPDVHIESKNRQIVMYYHGPPGADREGIRDIAAPDLGMAEQYSYVATSNDGLHFRSDRRPIALQYLRRFEWRDAFYVLTMPGVLYRSLTPYGGYKRGPLLFPFTSELSFRHGAVMVCGDTLFIFFSRRGDAPERILVAKVEMHDDWRQWRAEAPMTLLEPERDYEGGYLSVERSEFGARHDVVRQLRDPGIFIEGKAVWLLYSVAGEQGIGLARLKEIDA